MINHASMSTYTRGGV